MLYTLKSINLLAFFSKILFVLTSDFLPKVVNTRYV